ncbi:antibiotic biosynthesis monooxygenase [Micromonospora sp. NPDC049101]|uniref:putative quinol monooxygenase n=1 Tax=Micromonospora sp. NPDC049101 TaxID=3155032 RepID=UPI0033E94B5C
MFALVVRFDLKDDESAQAFDALVAETGAGIRAHEPGTLIYATHSVEGEPLARVFYECYADREAFDAHERQPHVMRFLKERELYTQDVRVEFLKVGPSKGVESS